MIVVIADDLTGAAELAGLGYRYNLRTEITTCMNPLSQADLLIIATNTRSLSRQAAEAVMDTVSSGLHSLRPTLVFKKIDSVLRGHVLAEINIQKNKLNLPKALIVPANPDKGRTVVDGVYFLHGQPLHLSSFSQDPEFPIASSRVPHMLAAGDSDVQVLKPGEQMPETGIIVGEVKEEKDLQAWCRQLDNHTLVAGAAGFFTAILASLGHEPSPVIMNTAPPGEPFLAVWGSTFHKSRNMVKKMAESGFPISYMPEELTQRGAANHHALQQWVEEISQHLRQQGKAGVAVNQGGEGKSRDALAIRTIMANAVALVAERMTIGEYLVEGGATAAAIIQKLGMETLYPVAELAPGVTRMSVKGKDRVCLTLKPGSYEWPAWLLDPLGVG